MNILVINHYAGSLIHGMEYRHFYLSREWVRLGHQVSIIAASFSHLRNQPSAECNVTEEVIEGINYYWVRTPKYQGNGFRRLVNMLIFSLALMMKKTAITNNCKPDIVIASSPHPFIIFGASRIAAFGKSKLVFEVRDLWPLSFVELLGISPKHPIIKMMQWTEDFAYRKADSVISLLPNSDLYMQQHGMAADKFVYIPNGLDVSEWDHNTNTIPEYHRNILDRLRNEGQFILGYAGSIGLANALEFLVEATALLKTKPISVVIVGKGPLKEILQKRAEDLGLLNIHFLPPVPRSAIPNLLSAMDALYIGWNKEPLYRFGISPNKLMDYMMAGKPIIHSVEAANDSVLDSGCGISVPPENASAILGAVLKLMSMSKSDREIMGARGRGYVLNQFDYRALAKRFLDKLNG